MADRYNVEAGDWNTDAKWAVASGGAGGASFPTAGDDAIFDDNSGNCTLDATAACDALTIGTVGALYTGTLDAGSDDVDIGSGGLDCSFGSSATLDLGIGTTWTCDGDWDSNDIGTLDDGTSTVFLTGVAKILEPGSTALFNVTIAIGASYTHAIANQWRIANLLSVVGAYTNNGAGLRVDGSVAVSGTFDGSAILLFRNPSAGEGLTSLSGTFAPGFVSIRQANAASVWAAGTWDCDVELQSSSGIDCTFTLNGNYIFTGDFTLNAITDTCTVDLGTNDASLTLQGDMITSGAGTHAWVAPGSGTITFSGTNNQDANFNGLTVEAIVVDKSAGTLTLSGAVTTPSFTGTDGDLDLGTNNVTLTASGAVSFASGFTVTVSGATIDCDTIAFDGQTVSGLTINASSSGTATGTTFTNCDASGGVEIDASDGTNTDGGGNTNINFGVFSKLLQGSDLGASLYNGALVV